MKLDYVFLSKTELFAGTSPDEVKAMYSCFESKTVEYRKKQMIFKTGDTTDSLGIVISGSVNIENDDIWGNHSIISRIYPGQVFGETYACSPGRPFMVNAVANEQTKVLFMNIGKVLGVCGSACEHHNTIIKNLLIISAGKNLKMSQKMLHITPKSIRGRLLSYFSSVSKETGSYYITIPFNRQQLADYLLIDRSAMCSELSKRQREGIIEYDKNTFRLILVGRDSQ